MNLSGYDANENEPEVLVRDLDSGCMVPASTLGACQEGRHQFTMLSLISPGMPQFDGETPTAKRVPQAMTHEVESSLSKVLGRQVKWILTFDWPTAHSSSCIAGCS